MRSLLIMLAALSLSGFLSTPLALGGGFVENRGQVDEAVLYYAHGQGGVIYFTAHAIVLDLKAQVQCAAAPRENRRAGNRRRAEPLGHGCAVRVGFAGGSSAPALEARGELPGRFHFLRGNDRARWRADVPAFEALVYREAWPGVDLVLRCDARGLAYELVEADDADAATARFSFEGADLSGDMTASAIALIGAGENSRDGDGSLRLETSAGTLLFDPARSGSARGRWTFVTQEADGADGAAERDDPETLLWSTFLGGLDSESASAVARDAAGDILVAGYTVSDDFPATPGAYDTSYDDHNTDAFVAKLDGAGSALIWGTFLGGYAHDFCYGLALDASGNPIVTGDTNSPDFPVTAGAYDPTPNGVADAFVTKLDSGGSALLWSTYLGSAGHEIGTCLAVDGAERVIVAGWTDGSDFPTTPQAYDRSYNGGIADAFLCIFDAAGGALESSTFLGGAYDDEIDALGFDGEGSLILTGYTCSPDFPTTSGAYDTSYNGPVSPAFFYGDVIVAELDANASSLHWSTFLGGADEEVAWGLAYSGDGRVTVAGRTTSADFPTTAEALDRSFNGGDDGFVATLNETGSVLVWSTFLGGSRDDHIDALRCDAAGDLWAVGYSYSPEFPTTFGAYDRTHNGSLYSADAVAVKLDRGGRALLWSSYIGGTSGDGAYALCLDPDGNPILAGATSSADFPATPGAHDGTHNGGSDVFLLKLRGAEDSAGLLIPSGSYPAGIGPAGMAAADVSGDGIPDLIVAASQDDALAILLGEGDGSFAAPQFVAVQDYPVSLAAGDLDGDEDIDLAVANLFSQSVSILLNQGVGSFAPTATYAAGTLASAVALGDLDNDLILDLVVANAGSDDVSVRFGAGDGTFGAVTFYAAGDAPWAVALADFSNDSRLDIVTANSASHDVTLREGDESGAFGPPLVFPAGQGPWRMAVAHLDGDELPDLVVACQSDDEVAVLLGHDGDLLSPAIPYAAGDGARAVAAGDLNGDGWPDLVVANEVSDDVTILLGFGHGVFGATGTLPAGDGPVDILVVDLNGDQRPDVVVANEHSDDVTVLLGATGEPLFAGPEYYPSGAGPTSAAVGDLDGDEILDLAVANYESDDIAILPGLGAGAFGTAVPYPAGNGPRAAALGDLDGDGRLDLAVAISGTDQVGLRFNAGDGTFGALVLLAAGDGPSAVGVADLDGDEIADLIVANRWSDNVAVLLGTGGGGFETAVFHAAGARPRGLALGDLNGDEVPDLVLSNHGASTVAILLGSGDGGFGPASFTQTGASPIGLALGDLDENGALDLIVANSGADNVAILLGLGDGGFAPALHYAVGDEPHGVAIGDLNSDGFPDIACANYGSDNVAVLLGTGGRGFTPAIFFAAGEGPAGLAAADLDGDGALDLIVPGYDAGAVAVLMGQAEGSAPGGVGDLPSALAGELRLRVWPNPLRAGATIAFDLPRSGRARLELFGVDGRVAAVLADGRRPGGPQRVDWRAARGRDGLPAGVYFLRLATEEARETRRVIVAR